MDRLFIMHMPQEVQKSYASLHKVTLMTLTTEKKCNGRNFAFEFKQYEIDYNLHYTHINHFSMLTIYGRPPDSKLCYLPAMLWI